LLHLEKTSLARVNSSRRSLSPTLSPARRRLFAAITIATPFILVGSLELALRLFHYGPDLSLFTTQVLHGKTYHIMNPEVKDRYFYRVAFNPTTSPDYFLVPKPPGTFRIFCLGASTTVGFPYYYNASFSGFLRDRLRRAFPDRSIDVINIGMTATNSFTALDMERDVMAFEPDLLIVYDGHNEFYGALGVASRESFGGSRWLSTLSLRLVHIRTYLLLRDAFAAVAKLFGATPPPRPGVGMMEKLARGKTIPYGSPQYGAALDAFRANLEAMRDLALAHGIPMILSTQVSNLRDLRPFVSGLPGDWPPERRNQFQSLVNSALQAGMEGLHDSASVLLREALGMYPHHAEAHYELGKALDALGRKREAEKEYRLARDYDELRFRASTEFNDAIRALDDGGSIACADIEQAFHDASPDSLIGATLILEHVHPNVRGYFTIANAFARVMRERGFIAPPQEWSGRDTTSLSTLWSERLVTEIDERIGERRSEVLRATWPFVDGIAVVDAIARSDTLGQIAEKVARGQTYWHLAHWDAIRYYDRRGDREGLKREYATLISVLPLVDVQPYLQLAKLCLDEGRFGEVRRLLLASLEVTPTILACRALADIAMGMSDFDTACTYYEKTLAFPQTRDEQAENGHLLALAYYRAGRTDRAMRKVMEVLTIKPDYLPAVNLLNDLGAGGSPAPARRTN
jgi:tetratricopeptide (TPR) repeat protein